MAFMRQNNKRKRSDAIEKSKDVGMKKEFRKRLKMNQKKKERMKE